MWWFRRSTASADITKQTDAATSPNYCMPQIAATPKLKGIRYWVASERSDLK